MNEEELEEWAKEKAEVWVGRLRDALIRNPYKILDYDALTYIIEKAFKQGYQKALSDINKNE